MSSYGRWSRCVECGREMKGGVRNGICADCNRRPWDALSAFNGHEQAAKPESANAWKEQHGYEGRMMVARVMAVCIDKAV